MLSTSTSPLEIERAVRTAVAERLVSFAIGWLLPMLIWAMTLALTAPGPRWVPFLVVAAQAGALGAAVHASRRDGARVEAVVFALATLLALSSIALFAWAQVSGEAVGFVLFTLCALAAILFPWGWRLELLLTATLLTFLGWSSRWVDFVLRPTEVGPVIAIAAALCVAIAEGNARGFRGALARRRGEEAALRELAASRDTYRDLTESARDIIWAADRDGRLTFVNENGVRLLGFTPAELVGINVDHFFIAHPTRVSPAEIRAQLASGAPLPPTVLRWETDRGSAWVETVAYAVRGTDDGVIGFRGISRDVTERWNAETALRESEARYRGVIESQDALIYRADRSGALTFLNDACRRKYGVADDGAPLDFLDFVHPDDVPAARAALANVTAGARYRRTSRGRTPEGWRWIEWEVYAIADERGEVTELQGVGHDVTERRAADEALQRSLTALREREEQLRMMAVRQTAVREEERKRLGFDLHDGVCQELVGIGILIESARQRGVSDGAVPTLELAQRYLRQVCEHLRVLARDLRPLQLADLGLGECLRALATGMTSESLQIAVRFPSVLPRLPEETAVAVYRVAQEALSNAVRHAAARTVTLTLDASNGTLGLEVRDDGHGFERQRLRSAALGLVAMEERAVALGGRLRVHSTPGAGTTVRLTCPLGGR